MKQQILNEAGNPALQQGAVSGSACGHKHLVDLLLNIKDRSKTFQCRKCGKKFTWKQMFGGG